MNCPVFCLLLCLRAFSRSLLFIFLLHHIENFPVKKTFPFATPKQLRLWTDLSILLNLLYFLPCTCPYLILAPTSGKKVQKCRTLAFLILYGLSNDKISLTPCLGVSYVISKLARAVAFSVHGHMQTVKLRCKSSTYSAGSKAEIINLAHGNSEELVLLGWL